MSPDREQRVFWRSKDTKGPLNKREFMEIRDLEVAKSIISGVLRQRLSAGNHLPHQEINRRIGVFTEAFDFATEKHEGKNRLTGEPYIFHPAAVTYMVAQDKHIPLDKLHIAVSASMNHDVLEDTPTLPSELRVKIGPEATRYVILLSKKLKVFEVHPEKLSNELSGTEEPPTEDQIELRKWVNKRKGNPLSKTQIYLDEILHGPRIVRRIKLRDREHNLLTLPPQIPPLGVHRTEKDQKKVDDIWKNIFRETHKYYIRIGLSLGLDGLEVANSLRNAYKEKSRLR